MPVALFITDSLGLPRHKPGQKILVSETYIDLVRRNRPDFDVLHVGIPGVPITELHRVAVYYKIANPDFVVLHAGIVDCAPRALGFVELEMIKRLRAYRLVKPFVGWLRKYRRICYTKPLRFEQPLQAIRRDFPQSKLITISILPASDDYESLVPGIGNRIKQYNQVLKRNSVLIDNDTFPRHGIAADHHHLTVPGMRILADKILENIR